MTLHTTKILVAATTNPAPGRFKVTECGVSFLLRIPLGAILADWLAVLFVRVTLI